MIKDFEQQLRSMTANEKDKLAKGMVSLLKVLNVFIINDEVFVNTEVNK